jgi:hypothetical protein
VSTHHLGCCCLPDVPGGNCDDSCIYASSYSLSDITGTWHYEHRVDLKDLDCACFGGATRTTMMEYSVDVSFSQVLTATLTRCGSGSNCRYEARGELTITTSIQLGEGSYCCQDDSSTLADNSWTRTATGVPFCLTMHCVGATAPAGCARTITGPAYWVIALQICDYPVVESHDFLVEDTPPGCSTIATFPNGIGVGGAVFYKIAKLKNPANITGLDMADDAYGQVSIRCVDPPIGIDIQEDLNCIPCVQARSPYGNFALHKIDEWSEQDPPDHCSIGCTSEPFASPQLAFGRTPTAVACSSTADPAAGPCYNVEDEWTGATAYGICASPCTWTGIVGGGWTFEIG